MILSAAITHAPWALDRRVHVERARRLLGGIPTTVVADETRAGIWATTRRAWQARPAEATHHLVVQDDVTLVEDFETHLRDALAVVPDAPVGCCLLGQMQHRKDAAARGQDWLVLLGATAGQCMVLPARLIEPWLAWSDRRFPASVQHLSDVRMALFLLEQEQPTWWTVPNLAWHAGRDTSLVGHRFGEDIEFQRRLPRGFWRRGVHAKPRVAHTAKWLLERDGLTLNP